MEMLKYIKNGTILVVPTNLKKKILEEIDSLDNLLNVKIISKSEFIKKYYFDYNKETLLYLINKYNIKLEVAKVYLENMYKLNDNFTSSNKLNELTLMKNNLLNHGLLKKDNLFKNYLKSHPIVFYGYDYYLKEDEKLINELKEITDVQVFRQVENPRKELTVLEFETIYDEVSFVFDRICYLIKTGVNINQIKLAGITSEYEEVLLDFSKFYNIDLSIRRNISLYETNVGKKACSYLKEGYDFYDTVSFLNKDFPNNKSINQIIDIFNQYAFFTEEKRNILDLIEDDFKKTTLREDIKKNSVEIIDLENTEISESNHVFLLGFNNGNFPRIKKDEDFIPDNIKEEIGISKTKEENKLVKDSLINTIFGINNLTITYKLKTFFDEYYPSTLISDYNMKTEHVNNKDNIHYSRLYDEIKLTMMLDDYVKFGVKNIDLEMYYNNLKIPYQTYDNKYMGIEKGELIDYLGSNLLLSYSALDNFYRCKFKFYLQNILKISKYEETISQKIGNIFHAVLTEAFNKDFNFEKTYTEEINKYELDNKEKYYLTKLKKELEFIVDTINNQNESLGLTNSFYEKKIYIDIENEIKTTFMGIVDKINYQETNDATLVSIIDYKTGNANLDLRYVPYGIYMQLPSYMFLIKKSALFKNPKICGIYLQKLLSSIPYSNNDLLTEKRNSLKLQGYSIIDEEYLAKWEPNYENSEVIKSLKMTKNGWYKFAKLLSFEEIDKLVMMTEEKIKKASQEILDCDFSIDPKRIDQENVSCSFCKFKDICYRREKDIINLKKINDLSYLSEEVK